MGGLSGANESLKGTGGGGGALFRNAWLFQCSPSFLLVSPIEYLSATSHISHPQEYHMAQEVISAQYWVSSYSL